jgi:hypothetical protein
MLSAKLITVFSIADTQTLTIDSPIVGSSSTARVWWKVGTVKVVGRLDGAVMAATLEETMLARDSLEHCGNPGHPNPKVSID